MSLVSQILLYVLRRYQTTAGHYLTGGGENLMTVNEMTLSFLYHHIPDLKNRHYMSFLYMLYHARFLL